MAAFIIILVLLTVLTLAAQRWGFDSRERMESAEWQRRADHGASVY